MTEIKRYVVLRVDYDLEKEMNKLADQEYEFLAIAPPTNSVGGAAHVIMEYRPRLKPQTAEERGEFYTRSNTQ